MGVQNNSHNNLFIFLISFFFLEESEPGNKTDALKRHICLMSVP